MTIAINEGLSRAKELSRFRSQRVAELRTEGRKIIGYLGIYPVLEMLTALDLVPYALLGDMSEPITAADNYLPTVVCPFLRSVMDLGLKGQFDFLDGLVVAHPCEVGEKLAHIWRIYLDPDYSYFIDTPHTTHASAQRQHRQLLEQFKTTLEAYTGKYLFRERLESAVVQHNEQRALVRKLYDLRRFDPPLISGSEVFEVVLALTGLPVQEGSDLLRQVIAEAEQRPKSPANTAARLLVWGSIIDNTALIDLIESTGASVVMDDTDLGSRSYFADVPATPDPLDGLAYRYLVDLKSPRTFKQSPPEGKKKDYTADLEARFGYIGEYAKHWNVNGVVMQVMRYCDIHAYEVPALKDYLGLIGLPAIYVEHDYNAGTMAQLRTRIQAFLEMIG